jgi:type VI secretion system protein ImpL
MSHEDFSRTFGAGGLLDGFFQNNLAPFVDTGGRAWSYTGPEGKSTESLQQFQRAQSIREAFFEQGGRSLGVRLEFRAMELDPAISSFELEVDGQVIRFGRDGSRPQSVRWPNPAAGGGVRLRVSTAAAGAGAGYTFEGPWALLRMFDRVRLEPGPSPDRVRAVFDVEGRRARFEVKSATPLNPIRLQALEQFQCPPQL